MPSVHSRFKKCGVFADFLGPRWRAVFLLNRSLGTFLLLYEETWYYSAASFSSISPKPRPC